ncbi:MAG: tRNA (adenosine(37)-N6)-threonylcarbamoyltransferase complex ATPase subunit type 1 TsaE [Bacteroidales bacterium]|nr:tRNA (adenosine(37)-N6)-threonylcarbamoyltransferase complex ATPase subunit type 1 TsaE [Bacteroidales bacterium]
MRHELTIGSLSGIDAAAREFLQEIGDRKVVAFYAPMGAGKTTFTGAVCRAKGVGDDEVSSPTFAIVNEYRTCDGEPLFHFDFYRIRSVAEALDIGFYEYIDSGCLCLIEWPENIEELLPEETLRVFITVGPDDVRTLRWED